MKLEMGIQKVKCKRLRKTILVFLQLFVKFYLLRFYEQVQPDVNPRGQRSGVSG